MPLLGGKGPRGLLSSAARGRRCGGCLLPSRLQRRARGHCLQPRRAADPPCSCRSQPGPRSSQSTEGWPSWEERAENQEGTQGWIVLIVASTARQPQGRVLPPSTEHGAHLWVRMSRFGVPREPGFEEAGARKGAPGPTELVEERQNLSAPHKNPSQEGLGAPGSKAGAVRLPFSSAGDTRTSSPIPNVPAELCPRDHVSPRASPPHFPAEKLLRR